MDGVSFHIDTNGLDALITRLNTLSALETTELMDGLGKRGMEQTRHRLEVEKRTPEGAGWKPNIEGTSTLFSGNGKHLAESINYTFGPNEARWGSGWIGARVHQFGAVIKPVNAQFLAFTLGGKQVFAKAVTIPARKYVGLSAANEIEMIETAERFLRIVWQ